MKHTGKIAAALAGMITAALLPAIHAGAVSPIIEEGTYSIHSRLDTNKVLTVEDGSIYNDGNICLEQADGSEEQLFNITKNGDSYTITSVASGLVLDVDLSVTGAGANIRQWTAGDLKSQLWSFENTENGYVFIKSALGTYMGIENQSSSNGANVLTAKNKMSEALWWKLVKEEDYPHTNRLYMERENDKTGLAASAAMLVRSELFIQGDVSWSEVTEAEIIEAAGNTTNGLKLSWKYQSCGGGTVTVERKSTAGMNSAILRTLLDRHPEGVIIYCTCANYAVLVTDYDGSVFYCADPSPEYSGGRIRLMDSYLGKAIGNQAYILNRVTSYWSVSNFKK